jgi:hypothetical protein
MILWDLLKLAFWIFVFIVIVVCVQSSRRKKKTWAIDVEGHRHVVDLQHGVWSGKRAITLDGNTIDEAQNLLDTGSEHRFDVDGHPCILKIRSSMLTSAFPRICPAISPNFYFRGLR